MKVEFPEKVWGRLATIADNRGVSIAEVIVEAAQGILSLPRPEASCQLEHVKPKRDVLGRPPALDWQDEVVAARIREMHDLGRSMNETARELGVSWDAVRTAYTHLGLPTTKRTTNPNRSNAA
jgi:hypothetical protein